MVAAGLLLMSSPRQATGQDLVYTPMNPAFGGSPYNYSWLMNSANSQNKYTADGGFGQQDPLQNFGQSLQRQILSQLTRQIVEDRFGNLNLNQQNSFEFGEFNIEVSPGPQGITITLFNTGSGEQTTITIPNNF